MLFRNALLPILAHIPAILACRADTTRGNMHESYRERESRLRYPDYVAAPTILRRLKRKPTPAGLT
jgi:hypothetical protein